MIGGHGPHRHGDRFAGIRRRLHLPDVERDVAAELTFHLERTVEELIAAGLSESEALEEARRRFGDERFYRGELERIDRRMGVLRRWQERVATLGGDLGYALRRLARSPFLSLGIVLTLALGLGANATMFGILDRLLLQPPAHVVEPGTVFRVAVDRTPRPGQPRRVSDWLAYPDVRDLEAAGSFSSVAIHTRQNLTLGRGQSAQPVAASLVSGAFFPMLGVQPAHGRLLGPADDRPGAPRIAVLGWGFWQRVYNGDPAAVGRTIDFGHGSYQIVGIAPHGFTGIDLEPLDVWFPFQVAGEDLRGTRWRDNRNWYWMRAIVRLVPGVAHEQAEAEATALHLAGRREQIDARRYDPEATVRTLPLIAARGPLASDESRVARWLAGVSLVVLLIACANVANLLLARSLRQRRDFGIRLALGVSRRRLLGQVLIESLVLAILGGGAALLATLWAGGALRAVLLPDVAWTEPPVAGRVVLFSLGLCLLTGLIAGLLPGIQASRTAVTGALKAGSRTVSRPGSRTRSMLTVLQAALSMVLLTGAGLFLRSLHGVEALDLGFEPKGLILIEAVYDGDPDDRQRTELYLEAAERIPKLSGIASATISFGLPFWSADSEDISIPGVDPLPELPTGSPVIYKVGTDYFSVMRLAILEGRGFTPADREGTPRVTVVNQTLARLAWPAGDALGRCIRIGENPCAEVVGVVEDARVMSLREGDTMQLYTPFAQSPSEGPPEAVIARLAEPPGGGWDPSLLDTTMGAVRRQLLALDPDLRFAEIQHYPDLIDSQTRSWRLGATLFTLFGALALTVAAVGLYSVLAFAVAQRMQELGIRSALGAARGDLVGMVLGHSLRLIVAGVALGLAIVWLAAPRIEPLLFETPARDPMTLTAVAAALLLTAFAASGLPAWRATRVDPSLALRAE